jgi:hypothetical protein
MLAVCISFPHRHTGHSVKPGTRKRSTADIRYLTGRENPPASALRSLAVAVCSKLLTWIARIKTPPQQNGCNYIADCALEEITDPVANGRTGPTTDGDRPPCKLDVGGNSKALIGAILTVFTRWKSRQVDSESTQRLDSLLNDGRDPILLECVNAYCFGSAPCNGTGLEPSIRRWIGEL